jgi:hypothetical protein
VPTSGRVTALGHDMARDRFAALARMNFSRPTSPAAPAVRGGEPARLCPSLRRAAGRAAHRGAGGAAQTHGPAAPPAGDLSAGQKTRVRWPRRSSTAPTCCCWTSPPRASTPTRATGCALARALPAPRRLRHPAGLTTTCRGGAAVRPACCAEAGRWWTRAAREGWSRVRPDDWRRCSSTSRVAAWRGARGAKPSDGAAASRARAARLGADVRHLALYPPVLAAVWSCLLAVLQMVCGASSRLSRGRAEQRRLRRAAGVLLAA